MTRIKSIGGLAYEAFGIWILALAIGAGLFSVLGWLTSDGSALIQPLSLFFGGVLAHALISALRDARHAGW